MLTTDCLGVLERDGTTGRTTTDLACGVLRTMQVRNVDEASVGKFHQGRQLMAASEAGCMAAISTFMLSRQRVLGNRGASMYGRRPALQRIESQRRQPPKSDQYCKPVYTRTKATRRLKTKRQCADPLPSSRKTPDKAPDTPAHTNCSRVRRHIRPRHRRINASFLGELPTER